MERTEKSALKAAQADSRAALTPGDELVDYTAPMLGPGENLDIFVGVNGETLRIKRGEPVRIKRRFYEVLQNAQRQERAAWQAIERAQREGSAALAAR